MNLSDKIRAYLPSALQIAAVAVQIAKVMPGTSSVVGAIELGIKVANGLANEIPVIEQTWADIQAAAAGGKAVTEDEWAAWLAQIEDAHAGFVAAVAKARAEQQTQVQKAEG